MRAVTLFFLFVSACPICCKGDTTTVFLVRHAEKQSGSRDPELTKAGQLRAEKLASVLKSVGLKACFASEFKRTQDTAAPSAKVSGVKVSERKAGKEEALAEEIRKGFDGQKVLFVGHSNTVPRLMKYLGASNVPSLQESDYDNLFVLQIDDAGKTTFMQLHFGETAAVASSLAEPVDP